MNPTDRLQEAIVNGRTEEALALLDQGLSVNAKLSGKETPLTLALLHRHWVLAEELLGRGAAAIGKVNQYYTCLSWAGLYGQKTLVEKLLERVRNIHEIDSSGYSALSWAVRFGLVPAFDRLTAAGASLEILDRSKNSLLHLAAQQSEISLVRKLLAARPGMIHSVNAYIKQTPLHLAATNQSAVAPAIVEALLAAGADPNFRDSSDQTPTVAAAAYNTASVLNVLLAAGAQFSQADRALALKLAITQDRGEQVGRLMKGLEPNYPLDETHPLRVAVSCRRWGIAEAILRAGFDPDSRLPENGKALLPWSMEQFLPDFARLLLEVGATTGRTSAVAWLDNLLLLRKVSRVQLGVGSRSEDDPLEGHLLVALQKNIESLGFVLTPELAERVLTLSLDELREFYGTLVPSLRALVGADQAYKPMYPNFPDQVREASSVELYFNAILHYWGDAIGQRILPNYVKEKRAALKEKNPLRPVGLASPDEASRLFQNLLEARGALSSEDKESLRWAVFSRGDSVAAFLPLEIPFRENGALLSSALLRFTSLHDQATRYVKNGVDVLRTATAYSGGDVSLAANTRFSRFPKALRRWLLAGLEADPNLAESLWRHPEKFKRLGERLHPGEFRQRFPKAWEAFRDLRSGRKPETFGSQIEGYLAEGQVRESLSLLQSRPGEFARRLDHLLRLSQPQTEPVVEAFARIAPALPTPLLLQLRQHFGSRDVERKMRVVFPKGEVGKLKAVDSSFAPLASSLCSEITEICRTALLAHFAQRPSLGACWLDDGLKRYKVPFALRSASKALRTVARGSRIPFSTEQHEPAGARETMRFFIWWRDGKSRTDLDLSALVLDEEFNFQTTLAYYNLKEMGGYHSGDITSAPNGASEFIDIEVPTFLARGSRYVLMVVSSFTSQPYCDLPECYAGFMRRVKPQSGEIYEPRTVANKFDLTANTTIAIPLILDLKEREVVWTDLSLKRNVSTVNNVHGNRSSLGILCEAMVGLNRPSLYDLFELHLQARGHRAPSIEEAQTVFCTEARDGAITPYDIPRILSEYL